MGDQDIRKIRFSLRTLFALLAGILIGLAPLNAWRIYDRSTAIISIEIRLFELSSADFAQFHHEMPPGKWTHQFDTDGSSLRWINTLVDHGKARIIAAPTLLTNIGRPACFSVGTEFPVPVPTKNGDTTIEYQHVGTRVATIPNIGSNRRIVLTTRAQQSQRVAGTDVLVDGLLVSGLNIRCGSSEMELAPGQTAMLSLRGENSAATTDDVVTVVFLAPTVK